MSGSGAEASALEPYAALFRAVALAQDRWATAARQAALGPRLTEPVAEARLEARAPLVQAEEMAGWAPHLPALAGLLLDALAEVESTAALAAALRLAFRDGLLAADRLAAAALADRGDLLAAWADESQLDRHQLAFVAMSLAGPPARLTGEDWLVGPAQRAVGSCPICGHEPLLARLDAEGGSRWMICSLCSSQYRVSRLNCPFCGNSAPDTLGYLVPAEGPRGWRIACCDGCGRYLKTIDERHSDWRGAGPIALLDAATTHLDVLAHSEGYGVLERKVSAEYPPARKGA